jgi:hypothetical protein
MHREREQQIKLLEAQLAQKSAILHSVLNSKSWKLLNRIRDARAWVLRMVGLAKSSPRN